MSIGQEPLDTNKIIPPHKFEALMINVRAHIQNYLNRDPNI